MEISTQKQQQVQRFFLSSPSFSSLMDLRTDHKSKRRHSESHEIDNFESRMGNNIDSLIYLRKEKIYTKYS